MHRSLRGVWLRKDHRDPDRQRAGGRVLRGQPDGGDPCSKQGHRRPGGLGALVFDGQRFPESPHPVLQPRHDRRDCVWHGEPRRSQEGDAQARARRRARARHRVPDGQRHLRALRGPDAIGGLRERMGLPSRASTSSTSLRAIWTLPPWRSSPPSSRKPSRAGLP